MTDETTTDTIGAGLPARQAAYRILQAVLAKSRPLDEALENDTGLPSLESRDRGFVRMLVATTLRRLGQIDDILGRFLEREPAHRGPAVKAVLRLATAQLLFLETPPHAAVSTAVDLAEADRLGRYKNLINAILRRVSREGKDIITSQDAARLNTPQWLWAELLQDYGETTAREIAMAHQTEAPLDLSVKSDPEGWAERLGGVVLPTGTVRLRESGDVTKLPGFAEGEWWVQDGAARLPVLMMGDVCNKRVLDLCAAPGGKTAQLAAAGARVTAVDRSANRMKRLNANMDRLGFEVETVVCDGAKFKTDKRFDAVLLDAPCSGTGTLRRHPDIAWLKSPSDVEKLQELQKRLLEKAFNLINQDGLVIYSTCSLLSQEGENLAAAFIEDHPVRLDGVSTEPDLALAADLSSYERIRSHPACLADHGGLDGFFSARLRKA